LHVRAREVQEDRLNKWVGVFAQFGEVTARPKGPLPTGIGEPTTLLVAVSITDTVPSK
jgi:hypothetical protein